MHVSTVTGSEQAGRCAQGPGIAVYQVLDMTLPWTEDVFLKCKTISHGNGPVPRIQWLSLRLPLTAVFVVFFCSCVIPSNCCTTTNTSVPLHVSDHRPASPTMMGTLTWYKTA